MTDYLERIFSPEGITAQEDVKLVPSAATVEGEEQVFRAATALYESQKTVEMMLPRAEWEEPRWNRIRLPDGTGDVREGERYRLTVRRPSAPTPDEELERRLRRSSRCYDTGFFWK